MKEKLRISYLEYIEANKTMAQLRREAEKGTEAVEQRNSMLQKNFTKLSFDYEASARDLKSSMGKCRELEFELAQLVKDLNTKGEALVKSVASEEMLKEKLDKTNSEFRKLLKAQEQLLVEKSKFESDSRTAEARNMQQIHELKSNLEKATTELAFISRNNHGLDSLAEEQGEEIESLKKALAVLKNENDIVTAKFLEADEFGKTGICKRDETIDLLTTRLFTSDKQVKALTDKSEFLSTQVTSLTTSLALETRNVEDLIAEVNLLKKSTETQAHRFNQQIEKLLSDKSYLSTEKKEFSDKLLLLRRELAEKKEELDLTTKKWKKSFSEKSDEFEKKCLAYNSMSDDYSALRERLAALSSMYNDALQEIELLKKEMNLKSEKQEETNAQLGTCRIKVAALTKEVEGLKQEILYARDKHNELTEKIRSGVSEKDKVIETHGQYKKDAQDQLRSKDDFIKKLDEKITFLDDSRLRLEQRIRELETDLSSTEKKLENTVEALVKENGIRDMLETQLKELRSSLQGEQRVRSELEKLQLGAKFCMSAGSSNILMMRDKKLQAVYLGLEDEAKRLSDLVKLMPLDFGSEEVYELPADLAKKKPRLASISMREKYTLPK